MGKLLEGYQNAVKRKEDSIKKRTDIFIKLGEKLYEDLLVCPHTVWTNFNKRIISYIEIKLGTFDTIRIELEKNKCNIYFCHDRIYEYKDIHTKDLIGSCECKSIEDIDNVLLMFGAILYKKGLYDIIKNRH